MSKLELRDILLERVLEPADILSDLDFALFVVYASFKFTGV